MLRIEDNNDLAPAIERAISRPVQKKSLASQQISMS